MPIVPYAKESVKPYNGTINANNDTALQSSVNESIERKIVFDAVNNTNLESQTTTTTTTATPTTITDEKPVKNLSNVFRDIDAKKIQSNAKDIEDESTNILQSRRNVQPESGISGGGGGNGSIASTTTSSTTTAAVPITKSAPNSISSSVNDASTTEQTNPPQANEPNVANVDAEIVSQKRHRRHRQQR